MRGWLRLWIALTLIWLIGLAAFAWMTWPPAPPPPGTWVPPAYAVPVPDPVRDALLHQREMVHLVAALAILPPVGVLLLAAAARLATLTELRLHGHYSTADYSLFGS